MRDQIYAFCFECGKPLPGIHRNRIKKNPKRRCLKCHQDLCRGYSLNQGYVRFTTGRKRYVHDVVMEALLERPLNPGEVVHHKGDDKSDDRPSNLKLYRDPGTHVLEEGHVLVTAKGFARPQAKQFRK